MSADVFEMVYSGFDFTLLRSDQLSKVELKPNGTSEYLSYANRHEWAELAERYVLHECDVQLEALRRGLAQVVPLAALRLFTPVELEELIVGTETDWSADDLRRGAEVRGKHPSVDYFWEVLAELSRDERALFMRFAWGRSRAPSGCNGVKCIVESVGGNSNPDARLPVAHTCFFQIDLPRYTSKEALRSKLLYAIYHCKDMDLA